MMHRGKLVLGLFAILAAICLVVGGLFLIAKFFVGGFILLTAMYVILFALLTSLFAWVWPRTPQPVPPAIGDLPEGPQIELFEGMDDLQPMDVDDDDDDEEEHRIGFRERLWNEFVALGANNNRRWEYLAWMTVLTLLIAFGNPGTPLLVSGIKELPSAVLSEQTQQKVVSDWEYFLHGDPKPQPQTAAKAKTAAPKEPAESEDPGWFWWKAFFLYGIATFVYFFFAFSDEFIAGMKRAMAALREHRERQQAQQAAQQAAAGAQRPQPGQPNQPQPNQQQQPQFQNQGWWQQFVKFGLADVGMEIVYKIIGEFTGGFREARQARRGGGI